VLPSERALAEIWHPRLTAGVYEPALRPAADKAGLTLGMSMTEKQGGSDVRANTTCAQPQPDGSYRITGHKWFTSAPMSDVLLVLAQAPGGLSCFVVPRVLPDGSANGIRLQRLKDKLGNRSNASAEVEYDSAVGWRLGAEGRGVRAIIEMVGATRSDCVLAAAAMMRHGVRQAAHHVRYRKAFGAELIDAPLMRNVIADLSVEAEAATMVSLWLAELTDRAEARDGPGRETAAVLRRLVVAACKYQLCKRGPAHAAEALECLGGNGYVEDSRMPRLYREAPLVSIWEGSGNVAALDVLRALATDPRSLPALVEELATAAGADRRLDAARVGLTDRLHAAASATSADDRATREFTARRLAGDLAAVVQASLLVRFGDPAVADAYVATRLDGDRGGGSAMEFGTLPVGVDVQRILGRTPGLR
jgi:putative acyl-CoA dehydrogenase